MLADRAEAEDVAQEAMLRLWRVAPQWRQGEAQVSTWLYRVVTNLCTDRLRARQRRGPQGALEELDAVADGGPGVEARMIGRRPHGGAGCGAGGIAGAAAQAVVLRHLEGLTNPEIAEVMEIGVEAVESLMARGKRALAARLAGRREELGYDGRSLR